MKTFEEFKFHPDDTDRLFKLVEDDCAAHKNWIASAVEAGDFERAQRLVKALRNVQNLFATLNGMRRQREA
jgi:hypothetical protein